MKKVEYSQVVRRKLKALKLRLTAEFGPETAAKALKRITDSARGLADFEEKGVMLSSMFDIHCDYRYLYVGHNYLFYRIERTGLLLWKYLTRGKILCISCLVSVLYPRNH